MELAPLASRQLIILQSLQQRMFLKLAGCVKKQTGVSCLQFAFTTVQLTVLFSKLETAIDYGWGKGGVWRVSEVPWVQQQKATRSLER